MMQRKTYIQDIEHISLQNPLSDEWMKNPLLYENIPYSRALDPDYKLFLSPVVMRRLGKILRRAIVTSATALKKCGIEHPDAIITGTGLGCIENTELFLEALCKDGEQFLKPTYFMQSTHNTISSNIGIQTATHSYNVTYAHKGISFECALFDALIQHKMGKINNALVGGHDEMTPTYFTLLQRIGYLGAGMKDTSGETAVSMIISDSPQGFCELAGMRMLYKPSIENLKEALEDLLAASGVTSDSLNYVMTGVNGNAKNDMFYEEIIPELVEGKQLLHYKHLFGESYTASALGLYAAASCLKYNTVPTFLFCGDGSPIGSNIDNILLLNHSDGKDYTLILLKKLCGN